MLPYVSSKIRAIRKVAVNEALDTAYYACSDGNVWLAGQRGWGNEGPTEEFLKRLATGQFAVFVKAVNQASPNA